MVEDTDEYLEYTEVIPKEIRLTVGSLSGQNGLRYAVVVLLLDEGYLPFSEIREKLDVHQQRLTEALDALQEGGMVKWQAEEDLSSRTTGNYCMTDYGKKIIGGFYEATRPKYQQAEPVQMSYDEIEEFGEIKDYQRSTSTREKERVALDEIEEPLKERYTEGDN